MKLYKIKLWNLRYENNRTRELKRLDWLPLPNRHDGEAFARLMLRADGPLIFAAWILLLQVASRCETRGTLSRDDGTPLDSESLAIRTRASKTLFDKALPALVQMGWIETVEAGVTPINPDDSAVGCDITALACDDPAGGCLEEKGRERREGKARAPNSIEVVSYCQELELTSSDGHFLWEKWEANGWMNDRQKIKDWKGTIRAWKAAGYLPSQKIGIVKILKPQVFKSIPDPITEVA